MLGKVLSLAEKRGWKALEKALQRDKAFEAHWGTNNPVFKSSYAEANRPDMFGFGLELKGVAKPSSNKEGIATVWQDIVDPDSAAYDIVDVIKGERGGKISQNKKIMQMFGPTKDAPYWDFHQRKGYNPDKWVPENFVAGHTLGGGQNVQMAMLKELERQKKEPTIFFADGGVL